ncbi:hypothetical protein [Aestuariivita boseongensis]|uniref:hypothetical protein n=1 Tax=Aestuariivita boseongensis TaxID=1470562 RepID=UPI0006811BB8|nr:hypothetical protein [Aestuariivita boseongensis]
MNKTRIITIGGTLLCAIGIGFFMQNAASDTGTAAAPIEPVARADFKPLSEPAFPVRNEPQQNAELVEPKPAEAAAMTEIVAPADPKSEPEAEIAKEVQTAALADTTLPGMPSEPEAPQVTCGIDAVATVDAGAMVKLDVTAPCLPGERVVVHHNGMMFTAATDDTGAMSTLVPALSETAVLIVEFANGEGAVATADVPSLMFYDRVVLQWAGDMGFELHAREYGAEYGSDGHVWSGAAREVTAAALGQGGFMTRLGDNVALAPRVVEVYTFPTGTASRSGDIALSVEAEVTAQNCGQDIEAQSLEVKSDGTLRTQYLTLAVPECSSIGDFLVLNNLVDDLKIAAN